MKARSTPRLGRAVLALIGLCGLLLPARTADASAFRVTPIRVDLSSRASSALMTLVNESDKELRFQISVYEWAQENGSGEMQLTPTKDIVFFPSLLTLKPAEERNVRVGTARKSEAVEKTYRIFFEELPPLETADAPGAQVTVITKLGVPIFIQPQKPAPAGEVANLAYAARKLAFDVRNNGNVHFFARAVRVTGLDADGKPVFQKQREGWYVLRDGSRRYEVELSEPECAKTQTLRVEVDTNIDAAEDAVLTRDLRVTNGACSADVARSN